MSTIKLKNHIATRLLTDDTLVFEIMEAVYPDVPLENYHENRQTIMLFHALSKENQKSYYCTNSVLSLLEFLKVSKRNGEYDWSVFNQINNGKYTFIFPNNNLLRLYVNDDFIHMIYMNMEPTENNKGYLKWDMFFVRKGTGEKCEHFERQEVQVIEEFIYKLLCFVFLTENDEVILLPNQKQGTKKSGKIINTLPIPLTIINSRWNSTVIRTEGFSVRGHFAIRWTGQGRMNAKIVFIEPFMKKGYIIQSKSKDIKS